jgi:RNA polymerase sigma factor (TIGR02999 family)
LICYFGRRKIVLPSFTPLAILLGNLAMSSESHSVTHLLNRIHEGSAEAMNELVALMYDRLRQLARRQLGRERAGHLLTTGDLVQEGVFRLLAYDEIAKAANRHQLYRAFTRAVRQLLIDHARRRQAARRGGGRRRAGLDDLIDEVHQRSQMDAMVLDEALTALAAEHPREAEVVAMRFFSGYEMTEVAQILGLSLSTVERDWRFARAWLREFLASGSTS